MEKKIIESLLLNKFDTEKVMEELGLDMIQLNAYVNTDEFQTLFKSTIKIRKFLVETELFRKCFDKIDASSVKEFFRLIKEDEMLIGGAGNQFFVEFYKEVENE